MKNDVKNRNSDLMIYELQDFMVSIESLNEYYLNSISTIQKMKLAIDEEYKIGLLVDDGIQKVLSAENIEEAKQFIGEMNLQKLPDGKKISDYIIVECDVKEKELCFSYSIKEKSGIKSKYVDPQKARREYNKIEQYENILISSTLSNIIIIFEQYLARVYKDLILINPKKYFQNQKVEIASIFNRNVKDIVVECVNNEVESNMFDSLKTLELISEKEGLDINRFRNIKDEFEEIYYRRNLYIHNNGVVNNMYLSNIKDKYKKGVAVNTKLVTDDVYLRNAINMLYKIVGTLFYEIQVAYNSKYDKWNKALSDIAFDLLCEKNYDVAEQLYFILSSCKQFCFRDKAMYRINYINAIKQQGKKELVEKELDSLDVSIATENYKIAKLCLQDKNEEVYIALSEHYPEPYSAELIRDWPIFIDFRKSDFYNKFVEEHVEDFETTIIKITDNSFEVQDE